MKRSGDPAANFRCLSETDYFDAERFGERRMILSNFFHHCLRVSAHDEEIDCLPQITPSRVAR